MEKTTPTVYMICGFIGAGKTTFARKLEKKTGAVRITKDEWLIELFGHDPNIMGFEEYDEKISKMTTDMAFEFVKKGIDVIIDDGFWVKSQRREMRKRIKRSGAKALLYYVKCPMDEMRERTVKRSDSPPEDSFVIDEEMFDGYMKYWEPPGNDEEYRLAG